MSTSTTHIGAGTSIRTLTAIRSTSSWDLPLHLVEFGVEGVLVGTELSDAVGVFGASRTELGELVGDLVALGQFRGRLAAELSDDLGESHDDVAPFLPSWGDGFIPNAIAYQLGSKSQAQRLVDVGLWDRLPTGYAFHEWDSRQPSRAQVEADREAARERQRRAREAAAEKRKKAGKP